MLVLIFGPDNVSSYQKFKYLYECYHLKLIRLIWCYVRDIAIAEDLAQDVYLQIFLHLEQIPEPGRKETAAYLFTMARRTCIKYFADHEPTTDFSEYEEFLTANADPIWEELTVHDLRNKFNVFLDSLTEPSRSLFIYGIVQKRPYREIAEKLNISPGAVAKRILRLRGRFQKCLDE